MANWLDLRGAVVDANAYVGGNLVATGVTASLPEVTFGVAEYRAMGAMEIPIPGSIDAMEATITKIGVDKGLASMLRQGVLEIELRFIQNVLSNDGSSKPEGCRAYIRGASKGIPSISIEPGGAISVEASYAVTRYRVVSGGEELWLIDRLNQQLKINGVDYYAQYTSLL